VLAQRPERLGDQAAQRGHRLGARDLPVRGEQLVEVARQQLVEDRLLGVEVVVEAAGQHTGGVADVPDRRGPVAAFREQLRRDAHQVGTPCRGLAARIRHVLHSRTQALAW
jgi:hypothetical protein